VSDVSAHKSRWGLAALLLGTLATLRIIYFGFADRRPHWGGAEGNDLGWLLRNHLPFRAPGGLDVDALVSNILQEHHQPPLYYIGIPAMFSSFPSLSFGMLLLTNAAALVVTLWAGWALAMHLRDRRAGFIAVVCIACAPGVAGRFTIVGVEPWHMGLLGLSVLMLLRVRAPGATWRHGLGLGGAISAGVLMKLPFVAGLLGPLVLESFAALFGAVRGPEARPWFWRMVGAGALVVGLLAIAFLPFTVGVDEFMSVARDEPTHDTIFTVSAMTIQLWWMEMLLGPVGMALLAMAALGAWRARLWTLPPPPLGHRPATLLFAGVVSLLVIHWLIPHKELRYVLPALICVQLLVSVGLDALWEQGGLPTRVAVSLGLAALAFQTYGVAMDPQWPTTPDDENWEYLEPPRLRLWMDPDDYGIEEIVLHPTFAEAARSYVLPLLEDPTTSIMRDMLHWELYGRNHNPVVGLPMTPTLMTPSALSLLRERATHMVANRRLTSAESLRAQALGYREIASTELPLPGSGFGPWVLYEKGPPPRQLDTFTADLGEWRALSDLDPGVDFGFTLDRAPYSPGASTTSAARLSGGWAWARRVAMERVLPLTHDLGISFRWRAVAEGGGANAWLELVEYPSGELLHRQLLSIAGAPDTGWLQFPLTDFSDVVPAPRSSIAVRLVLEPTTRTPARSTLYLDDFEVVREGLTAQEVPSLTLGPDLETWAPWVLGASPPPPGYAADSVLDEELEREVLHVVGRHEGTATAPRFGVERMVPVTLPFVVSFGWRSAAVGPGPSPPVTVELLNREGTVRLHAWEMPASEAWTRYAPLDLTPLVLDYSEVLVRIGLSNRDQANRGGALWIDEFSWTAPCESPIQVFEDRDGDGQGDSKTPHPIRGFCWAPQGWATNATDCNDWDADTYRGAPEDCTDEVDQDCDGAEAWERRDPDCAASEDE